MSDSVWKTFCDFKDHVHEFFIKNDVEHEPIVELAVAVILVDIAHVDNEFTLDEHRFIKEQLVKRFSISLDRAYELIKEAQTIITAGAEQNYFAETLKNHLDSEQRESLFELIHELIKIDGEKHVFEVKLSKKYEALLGVRVTE